MPYTVMIDDNFHYMDQDERLEHGTFATLEEALAVCRKLVDDWLADHHKPGMTATQLYEIYVGFGEDPFIIAPHEPSAGVLFSAWDYARERSAVICGGP
jgi:hypothetical protein